ncbi:MAG: extensin family protein, partial [Hyphomicrobiaceae bacterium]|nr:extensin family protein [Hyphomicrobiaceae bacterium]
MTGRGLAAAAAFCVLAASAAFAQNVQPGTAGSATPETAPLAPPLRGPDWPRLTDDKGTAGTAEPVAWSPQELEQALARCAVLLKGLDVVTVTGPPLREGTECGTPVPTRFISVGRNPQITLVPPPTLTCDMVAALARWLERDVQPLARKHLGAPIARIETMSSYSCRNAYGRAHGRVSEHGKAGAVDIGSFVTLRGHAALIIADWGPTARQIAAEVAAAAKAHAAAEAKALPAPNPQPPRITPVAGGLALEGQRDGQKEAQSAPAQQPAAGMMPLDLKAGVPIAIPGISLDQGQGPER